MSKGNAKMPSVATDSQERQLLMIQSKGNAKMPSVATCYQDRETQELYV
jgi:hypothetical protein